MTGDEPSKADIFVGLMDTPALAKRVVDAINREPLQPRSVGAWRVGRSLGKTIYLHPSHEDSEGELVGVMDTPELAARVVDALNGSLDVELTLADELRMVLNRHSAENESNTPDTILAEYLMGALGAYNWAAQERDKWYGVKLRPGWGGTDPL